MIKVIWILLKHLLFEFSEGIFALIVLILRHLVLLNLRQIIQICKYVICARIDDMNEVAILHFIVLQRRLILIHIRNDLPLLILEHELLIFGLGAISECEFFFHGFNLGINIKSQFCQIQFGKD